MPSHQPQGDGHRCERCQRVSWQCVCFETEHVGVDERTDPSTVMTHVSRADNGSPGTAARSIAGHWRTIIPTALLLGVAVTQMVLVRSADLSPWKGGGFGMFATTDGTAFRYVRLFVDAPGRSEELSVTGSLEFPAVRAQLFPSHGFLARLGRAAGARELRHGRDAATVRVEVWRVEFSNQPLRATERRLRSLTIPIARQTQAN
jgi:hypothetical protein